MNKSHYIKKCNRMSGIIALLCYSKFIYSGAYTIPINSCTDTDAVCNGDDSNPTLITTNLFYDYYSSISTIWIKVNKRTDSEYPWILASNMESFAKKNTDTILPCASNEFIDVDILFSSCPDFSPPTKYFILKPNEDLYIGTMISKKGVSFNLIRIPFSENSNDLECSVVFLSNFVNDHFVITSKNGEGDLNFENIKDKTICFVNTHYGDGFSWDVDLNFSSKNLITGKKQPSFFLCNNLDCSDKKYWSGINNSLNNDRNKISYFKLVGKSIDKLDIFDLRFKYTGDKLSQTGNIHQVISYSQYTSGCTYNICQLDTFDESAQDRPAGYPPFPTGPYIPPTPTPSPSFSPTASASLSPSPSLTPSESPTPSLSPTESLTLNDQLTSHNNHKLQRPDEPSNSLPAIIGGAVGGIVIIIVIIVIGIVVFRKKGKKEIEGNTPDAFEPSGEFKNENDDHDGATNKEQKLSDKNNQGISSNNLYQPDLQNEQIVPNDEDYVASVIDDVQQMNPAYETEELQIDESEIPDINDILF